MRENFTETHNLQSFAKFPYLEIRGNFGILRSDSQNDIHSKASVNFTKSSASKRSMLLVILFNTVGSCSLNGYIQSKGYQGFPEN